MLVDLSLLVEDRDGDRRRAIDGIRRQRVGLTGNGEAAKRQRECARLDEMMNHCGISLLGRMDLSRMFCGEGEDGNILYNSRIEAIPHRPRTISPLIGKAPRMAWNTLP